MTVLASFHLPNYDKEYRHLVQERIEPRQLGICIHTYTLDRLFCITSKTIYGEG